MKVECPATCDALAETCETPTAAPTAAAANTTNTTAPAGAEAKVSTSLFMTGLSASDVNEDADVRAALKATIISLGGYDDVSNIVAESTSTRRRLQDTALTLKINFVAIIKADNVEAAAALAAVANAKLGAAVESDEFLPELKAQAAEVSVSVTIIFEAAGVDEEKTKDAFAEATVTVEVVTAKSTPEPTAKPTDLPTDLPTAKPTAEPTAKPTAKPTDLPTGLPTAAPTPDGYSRIENGTCASEWIAGSGDACNETQYGCPSTPCDGDSDGPWCLDENLDVNGSFVNWFYCTPTNSTSAPTTSPTCFEDNQTGIPGCECHASCASCGYTDDPTGPADCIACADGGAVVPVYHDGTGWCNSTTSAPTTSPTAAPTGAPTAVGATAAPTGAPTSAPTTSPTAAPTGAPTSAPTTSPTQDEAPVA